MKNKLILLALILITVIFLGGHRDKLILYAEDIPGTNQDINPPQLTGVSISPSVVYFNSQFTVNVSATDDYSGVKSVRVIIGPAGADLNRIISEITSPNGDGNWSYNLLMPSNVELGLWRVKSITLTDNSEKVKEYLYGTDISTTFYVVATSCANGQVPSNQSIENCNSSQGTWSTTSCSCTCPTNYYLSSTGSCVYQTACGSGGSAASCTNSQGTWSTTFCSCTCPTNRHLDGGSCVDNVVTCQKDEWICESWSTCVSGKQHRTCTLSFDCPGVTEVSPKTEQTCSTADENNINTPQSCYYKLSDYGVCINGKQSRKVLSSSPEGCVGKMTESLERACTVIAQPACSYNYSSWSDCKDNKKTRSITSMYPENCLPGNPIIEENCKNVCIESDWICEDWSSCGSEGAQSRKCALSKNCLSTQALQSPQVTRNCIYASNVANQTEEKQLPAECLNVGWDNKNDCELYLYHSRIVSDCQDNGLNSQVQCREYFLNKYGKPLKCQNLSDTECNNLIDRVILSDLKTVLTQGTRDILTQSAGLPAVIDIQNQTIVVNSVPATENKPATEKKEIKVDNLPIVSSSNEQISISLVSTGTSFEQKNLSPVAITFDSDGDGLPDDMENRLGTDPNNKDTDSDGYSDAAELRMGTNPLDSSVKKSNIFLSGIDKALIGGKTLEQPKYSESSIDASLVISSVATVATEGSKNGLKFEGKAKPSQVVTLFIYSTMPIVVTVQADVNGNWVYELDKTMVDGTHEVYVAVNNDEGKIVETSLPTPFFIQEAQAVSVDDFTATGDATQIVDQSNNLMMLYILGGLAVVLVLVAGLLIIKQRFA
ncbi:MAG: Ig-like domain-containing protein [Candidatus Paceibacterota bacterium]|jgi:hypothetical protein